MNIKEAKNEIKNAMTAYFTKNEFGEYVIPVEKQRPVFLMGPPGIGKTAIMEQIAQELGVGLVSYSMTHHTRQSALGLPFIVNKNYGGKEYSVSEYTMSEIIASVYDMIEETGHKEGILFLDEINCVSETLAPAMLQFLQYKIFGRHRVPNGWIVVTAGNPPEYNNSVHEFDIVTWDRLKRIDVEANYGVWKEYAVNCSIHPSVTTYLDIKKADFYKIETTVDGKSFVTARGWVDLSDMIKLYEKNGIAVREQLVSQYLQNKRIARDFAVYYDLFNKYKSDYQVESILDGTAAADIRQRAKKAGFDERLSLIGLLLSTVQEGVDQVAKQEATLKALMQTLGQYRMQLKKPGTDSRKCLEKLISDEQSRIDREIKSGSLSVFERRSRQSLVVMLGDILHKTEITQTAEQAFGVAKQAFDDAKNKLQRQTESVRKRMNNLFIFSADVFGIGQEITIILTELTIHANSANFIGHYGCEEYFKHNKELLFYERQLELNRKIDELNLD